MSTAKNVVKPVAAPVADNADTSVLEEVGALQNASLDFNEMLDRSSEEMADLYGEMLYPWFAPSDEKGKTKPYNRQKMVAFLDRVKPRLKKAIIKDGYTGGIRVLREEGLKMQFEVSGKAAEAFQVEEHGSFNWSALFKWVGGGLAVAVIVYGAYKLYVHYSEKGEESSNALPPVM